MHFLYYADLLVSYSVYFLPQDHHYGPKPINNHRRFPSKKSLVCDRCCGPMIRSCGKETVSMTFVTHRQQHFFSFIWRWVSNHEGYSRDIVSFHEVLPYDQMDISIPRAKSLSYKRPWNGPSGCGSSSCKHNAVGLSLKIGLDRLFKRTDSWRSSKWPILRARHYVNTYRPENMILKDRR